MGAFKMAKTVLRSMFNKPATLMYPVVEREYPERTRGSVDIDTEQCILCGLCTRRCPAKAIETRRNTGEWIIHRMKCIQCGECIDVCPKECLSRNHKYTEPGSEKVVDRFEVTSVKKEGAAMAGEGVKENLVCDMDACVFCGLCVRNCPVDALKVDRAEKLWEVDAEACVKCGACIDKCPKKCLKFGKAEDGKPVAAEEQKPAEIAEKPAASKQDDKLRCNVEDCIYCGLCARNCPVDALTVDRAEKLWKVDEEACIKCEACINKCPKECLFLGEPAQKPQEQEADQKEAEDRAEAPEADLKAEKPDTAEKADAPEQTEKADAPEPEKDEPAEAAEDAVKPAEETPQTAKEKSVPVLDVEKCLYCRMCENVCPEEAIVADMDDWRLDKDKCASCRACIDACPAGALKMS